MEQKPSSVSFQRKNSKKNPPGKILIRAFIFLLAAVLTGTFFMLGINRHVMASSGQQIISPDEAKDLEADCIIVLGAKVYDNGQPSHMLEDRLLQAIELYKTGASRRILMSGDHGRTEYDEVNPMKEFAINKGIPSEHIFMDHAGFSTYESLYRARDIFQAKKVIIVTQRYHLYRALYTAEKLGLEAYGVASDPRTYVGQEARELREVLARVKDFFYCIFTPKPKYLGESIPISGNGNLTNDK